MGDREVCSALIVVSLKDLLEADFSTLGTDFSVGIQYIGSMAIEPSQNQESSAIVA